MSDDKDKKEEKGEKKGAETVTKKEVWLGDLLAAAVGPMLAGVIIDVIALLIKHRAARSLNKLKHVVSWGEVLVKLRAEDPNACDKIVHFVGVGLTEERDRIHFQEHVAQIGGDNPEPSVAMLKLMAALPDHPARVKFADDQRWIGPHAGDPIDRGMYTAKSIAKSVMLAVGQTPSATTTALAVLDSIGDGINTQLTTFGASPRGQELEQIGKDVKANLRAKLAALKK